MSSDLISSLDNGLMRAGEDISLRRSVGVTNKSSVIVGVRAAVRSPTASELVAGIPEDHLFCIFSPTQINNAQWPGGHVPVTSDVRIPSKALGDDAFIRGKWRAVEQAQGFYPGGELCRIEMQVQG